MQHPMIRGPMHRAEASRARWAGRVPRAPRRRPLRVSAQSGPLNNWFSSFVKPGTGDASSDGGAGSATLSPPVLDAPGSSAAPGQQPVKRDYLEARQVSIFQLLDSDEMKFDIPVYQRPYSWQTKQVYEMLTDFSKAYASGQEYFIGAIVTTRISSRPSAPFQLIDGQQRLTTLFIMLACLHSWAQEQDNTTLQQRVWRMLHLDADPLDEASSSRFRLRLRDADDEFWRANLMETLLPNKYFFTGLPAAEALSSGAEDVPDGALPLEAESHWRLYSNAAFMRKHLETLCAQDGFNLQDFMFHVLRNCYVVMMTARDEASSFNIFSTLNSRGMDLSEVDKLKADLLQVLAPPERQACSAQWSEMENLLGSQEFHRVFDHMKELAAVLEPVQSLSVLEYFTQDLSQPATAEQIIKVALDYARILLQLRHGRWDAGPATGSTLSAPPPGSGDTLTQLAQQSAVMNMFDDEAWVPVTLEFFLQVPSPELRLRFLQSAETLQLLHELNGDAAAAAARWSTIAQTLLSRPLDPEAVLERMSLSSLERAALLARLESKELAVIAPQRTLAHLLLRAEGSAHAAPAGSTQTSAMGAGRTSRLQVERIVPQQPPEGSAWRRTKVHESGGDDAKYWYEVQRLFWQGKLGNLVLLPLEDAGAREVASRDFEPKAAFYRACGAEAAFPRFTGEVSRAGGRYSAHRFSFEECRARHNDLVATLAQLYQLQEE